MYKVNIRKNLDLELYLVLSEEFCKYFSIFEIAKFAAECNVNAIQLREKNLSSREFVELSKTILKIIAPFKIPLIINDRIDVALASSANGVHLGQSDIHVNDARKILGKNSIIGVSVETLDDVYESEKLDVDYIGVSPVFYTRTKHDIKEPWGLSGLKKIRSITNNKIVAIGGINKENAFDVLNSGANSLAIVSAIVSSKNPKNEILKIKQIIGDKNAKQKVL